jgi:hypothetical protein
VTAIYAADGHELRKDWYGDGKSHKGRHAKFHDELRMAGSESGILDNVANTDFLQVVSLFYTRELRRAAVLAGKEGKELPQITGKREALLNLPLAEYQKYEKQAEDGFLRAAKFLRLLRVYRINDLPYQTQIVPLAAILADVNDALESDASRLKLEQWYWCGVFGELYGSAVDTRIAKDFDEVTKWLRGGVEPTTVTEASFRMERLKTMRMRLSAAYKGVNILMMKNKALDFRSGQEFSDTMFFDEAVDIHHIFPKAWCLEKKIEPKVFDSIINKTPLSYRTNRIIGGVAPSLYLASLEQGDEKTPPVLPGRLDSFLSSHLINPELLRANDFNGFMLDRQRALLALIEGAMGKKAIAEVLGEGIEYEVDEDVEAQE